MQIISRVAAAARCVGHSDELCALSKQAVLLYYR